MDFCRLKTTTPPYWNRTRVVFLLPLLETCGSIREQVPSVPDCVWVFNLNSRARKSSNVHADPLLCASPRPWIHRVWKTRAWRLPRLWCVNRWRREGYFFRRVCCVRECRLLLLGLRGRPAELIGTVISSLPLRSRAGILWANMDEVVVCILFFLHVIPGENWVCFWVDSSGGTDGSRL